MHWWMLYGVLTAAMCVAVYRAHAVSPQLVANLPFAASTLVLTFFISNLCSAFIAPFHMQYYPAMDALCVMSFALLWASAQRRWQLVLSLLFTAQMAIHVVFFTGTRHDFETRYRYDLALNMIYILQLLCVPAPAVYVLARRRWRSLMKVAVVCGISTAVLCGQAEAYFRVRTYGPEAQSLFNSLSVTTLTQPQQALINYTIQQLQSDGIWQLADMVHAECGPTSEFALKNWVTPGRYDLTVSGSPTFAAYSGYSGDGTAGLLNTNVGSNALVNYTLNSANVTVYTPASTVASNNAFLSGLSAGGGTMRVLWRSAGGSDQVRINDNVTLSFTSALTVGTLGVNRDTSTSRQMYLNGVNVASDAQASVSVSANTITFLNNSATFAPSTTTIGMDFVGASLTPTQAGQLNTLMTTFCTKISSP